MTSRSAKAQLITGADGALGPGGGIKAVLTRTLDDLPNDLSPFAREVAVLTLHRAVQAKVLQPIMDALKKLEARTDWSGGHLVIEHHSQTWRDAPFKHYKSFPDFYARELETTWGKWEDLQRTWKRVAKGEISEAEGQREIEERAKEELRKLDKQDEANLRPAHRPKKEETDNNVSDVVITYGGKQKRTSPVGNSAAKALRVLRDKRPDIHARVLAGELSPHAGMIEAGFRKKAVRKTLSAFERVAKQAAKLSDAEWEKLKHEEDHRRTRREAA
jgi:hypothetical protein